MKQHKAWGLMLAVSLSFGAIAGCQAPGAPVTATEADKQAATQTGQHTAQAMAEEQEMDYYGFIADEAAAPAAYQVMATASASPSPTPSASASASPAASPTPSATPRALPSFTPRVAPTPRTNSSAAPASGSAAFRGKLPDEVRAKIEARHAALKAKVKARTDKMTAEKEAIGKAVRTGRWVKNSDGTETQSIAFSVEKSANGQTFSRSVKMTRVRKSDDKTLVSANTEFASTHNGTARKVTRSKTLNPDGSYTVVFHSEMTFKDGSKRTADWTKTIGADGAVAGTGTIVWTGKTNKAINLTFGGTEEAETATSADAGKTETAVTSTAEGEAKAEVKTPSGAVSEVQVQADVDAAAVTEPASATP